MEKELSNPRLFGTILSTVDSDKVKVLSCGKDNSYLNSIERKLHDIAALKSLIAWLREAIKARETLKNEIEHSSLDDYCKMVGTKRPEREVVELPEHTIPMTEDDYFSSLSIAERNRYYELETKVAVIGKYIHNDGPLSKERQLLMEKIEKPSELCGSDSTALVYQYMPSVDIKEVNELFFNLQATYREYQAELNGMKHACEIACNDSKMKCNSEYTIAFTNYQLKQATIDSEYNNNLKKLVQEWEMWKQKEGEKIANLKIVIPNSLKSIYEEVNSVGKKKIITV